MPRLLRSRLRLTRLKLMQHAPVKTKGDDFTLSASKKTPLALLRRLAKLLALIAAMHIAIGI